MIDIRLSDNLELMAEIEDKTVDLIYSDILYGTGRKFKDYQDLKPIRSEIENHYIPRIKEMYRILKDTGSIYLQMDTKISHWIRCIMDDIFGYDMFLNEIIIKNKRGGNGKFFLKRHDNILFYAKTKSVCFNKLRGELYNIKNQAGKWAVLLNTYKGALPYPASLFNAVQELLSKKINATWTGAINIMGAYFSDVWTSENMSYKTRVYDTQKPKPLIERIIKASSNEGDLVADFYAGSFTTAEVCKDLNRNFIGCDINPKAVEIGKKRIKENKRKDKHPTLFKEF